MFSSAEKTNRSSTAVQQKVQQQTFFRKAGEESFFGGKEQPVFFNAPVHAKLSVSSPDDPQEKEADAVADKVMRMADPADTAPIANQEEKIQAKPGAEPQAREEEETVLPKIEVPRINTISRKEEGTGILARLYRSAEEGYGELNSSTGTVGITSGYINCKHTSLYRSNIIQCSERGPPTGQIPLEQSLASSKGGGSALPGETRQFMETRFNADFSGVRIHTDATARSMSSNINAQAFAHGNDIYFNEGKYAPHTGAGGTLLAHELTHTIQQGASSTKGTSNVAPKIISRKSDSIQRSVESVPAQLTNAVTKAKTLEGKIDANKPGPDGNRTGWEHLVEIFKTTFGDDKVVSGRGGTSVKGAVAEQDIKQKRTAAGAVVDITSQTHRNALPTAVMGQRDAMPSWCGIFVFWALNKSGVPMPKWKLGEGMIKPEAARPPGVMPLPGDIAYRNAFSHFAMVESVKGNTVTTVNGNTAGEDNLGGQVQSKDHPIAEWTAFFNPLLIMQGNLGSGEGALEEKPKTLRELRQELFNVNRKEDIENTTGNETGETNNSLQAKEEEAATNDAGEAGALETSQAKPELGSLAVTAGGKITTNPSTTEPVAKSLQAKKEEQTEETTIAEPLIETKLNNRQELSPTANCSDSNVTTVTVQPKAEPDELQAKEEEQQEEKTGAAPVSLQTKACCDGRANEQAGEVAVAVHRAPLTARPKEIENISSNSSLTNEGMCNGTSSEVQDRGPPAVQLHNSGNTIQCGWFDSAMSFVDSAIDFAANGLEAGKRLLLGEARDFVMAIPGYRALRVVLGEDPITGEAIERNGHTFIEAAFDIMPGGRQLHEKLNELGALNEAAQWIDNGIAAVESLVSGVIGRVERFWAGLTLDRLRSPSSIFEEAGNIIHSTISSIIDYAVSAGRELLEIVKRWLLDQVVGFIRGHTTAYPLLCVILGQDPIKETPVVRNGTTILSAILELGGEEGVQQRTQMQQTGTFQKAADWIDRGIGVFGNLLRTIRDNFGLIWSVVSIDALMHPIDKFNEVYNTFAAPVSDVLRFMGDVARVILQFIKEALMVRLSAWARTVRGYFLVTVIIGKDPFTDAVVPRNVENLIHGFMSLMEGGEEQFNQMRESGAIARATQRIDAAVARLNMTPVGIIQLFTDLWNSFSIQDLAHPITAFQRIIDTFGEPIGRLIAFVVEIVKIVVVVILEIMNFPFELINNIIRRTIAAFNRIKNDPIGFLKNLLRAIKQGFIQFFDHITTHLMNGVVGWLMAELRDANVPAPTDFSLRGIIGWVLQVLGISMDAIWAKLAAHPRIGPERVARLRSMINTLEGIWTFIRDVQERGIAAIWERIQEQLSNLWNTVLDAVKNWIMERIVNQVTARLLSMLDPTGIMAVVNSAIAIFRAIQSFIRYLRQMLEVINSFVNGVADIAEGNVTTAANYLERTMGSAMPIIVGFLANQVGLSGIGRRIAEIIGAVREMVDRAMTWLVNRAVDTGFALFDRLMAMGRSAVSAIRGALSNLLGLNQPFTASDGENHRLYYDESGPRPVLTVASNPAPINTFLATASTAINALPRAQKTAMLRVHTNADRIHQSMQDNERLLGNEADRQRQVSLQRTIQTQMNTLAGYLAELLPVVGQNFPPAIIPPMVNGVKARSFTAEYISSAVPDGSEASSYDGRTLLGWGLIAGAGLNTGSTYVKMHLLPHRLGGDAVDSNLTPAPGQSVNLVFSRQVEVPAITAKNGGETIWYRFTIDYHSGTLTNSFPSSLRAEWGTYRRTRTGFEKVVNTANSYGDTIPLPPLTVAMVINSDQDRMLADFLRINFMLARLLIRIKNTQGNFTSSTDVINKVTTYATNSDKTRIGDFDNEVANLAGRLANYNAIITY